MKIFGNHEARTIEQLQRCVDAEDGARGVLCADGHVGYSQPIGGVVAYRNHVSVSGVGYDIGCGVLAVKTTLHRTDVKTDQAFYACVADEIQRRISFGLGGHRKDLAEAPVIDRIRDSPVPQQRALLDTARAQLGTVGSGNHYVDVLADEAGWIWVATHFGSRGFGWKTAKGFMNIASGRSFDDGHGDGPMDAPPLLLEIGTSSGNDYIEAMQIAGAYAAAGRDAVIKQVLTILDTRAVAVVHNHHNFAWFERHDGEWWWVVRKGATPAWPGQQGFVGGSMGDIAVIVEGVASLESNEALASTVHGAGRVMTRTQAAGKQRWTKGQWQCGQRDCGHAMPLRDARRGKQNELPKCPACGAKMHQTRGRQQERTGGSIDYAVEQQTLVARGIEIRGGGADEAPPVYRPLAPVLAAHAGTVRILHTLTPLVVVMAGRDVSDPYQD